MDYFLAICQALGWALAIGALAGAFVPRRGAGATLLLAAVIGAAVGALSMSTDDEGIVGGLVVGAVFAPLAALVVSSIVSGAARRTDSGGALGFIVALVAVAMAALCLLVSPIALVALVAVVWLALARRRRSDRKYEGLRILR